MSASVPVSRSMDQTVRDIELALANPGTQQRILTALADSGISKRQLCRASLGMAVVGMIVVGLGLAGQVPLGVATLGGTILSLGGVAVREFCGT